MTVTNPALGCKPCQKMQFTSQAATSLTCSDCKIRIMTSGFFPILLTMVYLAGDDAKHLLQSRSFLHVQHVPATWSEPSSAQVSIGSWMAHGKVPALPFFR